MSNTTTTTTTATGTTTGTSTSYAINMTPNIQYGWVCPICGAAMNPNERECIHNHHNQYHWETPRWWEGPYWWQINQPYCTTAGQCSGSSTIVTAQNAGDETVTTGKCPQNAGSTFTTGSTMTMGLKYTKPTNT